MTSHAVICDLLVVGGGLAGVCAAVAAARNGAHVVLVQNRSVLGGNASSEIRMHTVGADFHGRRPGARETGLIEEIRLEDAARNPHRSYSQWDLLLYDKIISEPNVTLLLDTECVGCTTEDTESVKRILSVEAVRHSTEDRFVIHAKFFADCSGDGRLGFEAGADFRMGREAAAEFGEDLGLATSDHQTLGSSIMFTAKKYDHPQPFFAPIWARRFEKSEFKLRPIDSYEYGYWWAEWGGQLDTLKDNALIRHELLRIALGIWDYVKNSGEHPGSSHWALEWVGAVPGKRESRRFLGPHVLSQADLLQGTRFEDAVAYGGWPLDLHPPSGIDAIEEAPCRHIHLEGLYTIPLRCLYSRNISNLFFAGRNISATHVAFASTRVMATCAVMGQAVGTAAALCSAGESRAISTHFTPQETVRLQQRLLRDDAFLLDLKNSDPRDLARQATVSASSQSKDGSATHVIDGMTRPLPSRLGSWADEGLHRWESTTLPAWIELTWPTPQRIQEIHFTFDSGLERELTLSAHDATNQKVVRAPQPELVQAYEVLLDDVVVCSTSQNLLRKRIHRLERPVSASLLRLRVLATHGIDHARVFEIRAYAP